ncbi:12726_t:CDS:2, partial [Cetraspora pellucida]
MFKDLTKPFFYRKNKDNIKKFLFDYERYVKLKETSTCTRCQYTKPVNEFLGLETKDKVKRFCTYNDCHNRTARLHQNVNKEQLKIKENDQENDDQENDYYENNDHKNTNNLEIIELLNLCDHIQQLLNAYSTQLNDNLEKNLCLIFN